MVPIPTFVLVTSMESNDNVIIICTPNYVSDLRNKKTEESHCSNKYPDLVTWGS